MAKFFKFPFAVAGLKTAIPDPTQPSGSVSYESGFTSDYTLVYGTDPNAKAVPLNESNQLYFDITDALNQYQTHGFPDFITSADNGGSPYPYDIYAVVRYDNGGGVQIYENLVDGNIAIPGTDNSWQIVSGGALGLKPGDILAYGGGAPRAGFLLNDHSAVSRTIYSALFAVIGTTFGAGDGSTTFNLPDSRRRVLVGSGGSGTLVLGNAVGNYGGEEAHTQTLAELFPHFHKPTGTNNDFTISKTVNNTGTVGFQGDPVLDYTAITQTDTVGGGQAFNIIQPSLIITSMIKY